MGIILGIVGVCIVVYLGIRVLLIIINDDETKLPPDGTSDLRVRGPFSDFFPPGVTVTEELAKSIIGLPIKDHLGNVIGGVYAVDWESGEWYGLIISDRSVSDKILENSKKSMEIVADKEEA